MKQFYVYELVVIPDGTVCYVGKGTRRRMYIHRRNLKNSRYNQAGLYRRLRELIASGKDFEPHKVFETDIEAEALAEEKRRIEAHGFETLFNSTTRQGLTVADVNAAHRQALSKARREYVAKLKAKTGQASLPEVRLRISNALKGRSITLEHARHVSAAKKGVRFTAKHRRKLSKAAKARGYSQAAIDAMRKANLNRCYGEKFVTRRSRSNLP